jgi:hypothetical protein
MQEQEQDTSKQVTWPAGFACALEIAYLQYLWQACKIANHNLASYLHAAQATPHARNASSPKHMLQYTRMFGMVKTGKEIINIHNEFQPSFHKRLSAGKIHA